MEGIEKGRKVYGTLKLERMERGLRKRMGFSIGEMGECVLQCWLRDVDLNRKMEKNDLWVLNA